MSQSFPTSVPSYSDTVATETLATAGGGRGLSTILDDYGLDIAAIAAKLGVDSSAVTTSHDYKLSAVTGSDKAASKAGTETLTNKTITLGANTVSGTLAQFNSAVTDADLASLAGTETLTNKTLSTGSTIDANVTVTEVLKKVYPVGCIYFSTNSTNPGTSLGFGTWSAFGAGRVPVGFDSGQTEFDTDEETGGAKTHTLTTSEIPSHAHTLPEGRDGSLTNPGAFIKSGWSTNAGAATAPSVNTGSAGTGGSHNNLQPYIVVRMWKRTA